MIHIVSMNAKPLTISVNPTPVERKLGEDQSLWRQLSDEVAINRKKFYLATNELIYLEDDRALYLAAKIVEFIKDDEGILAVKDRLFHFAVGFDKSIYILTLRISDNGVMVEDEALLEPAQALCKLNENTAGVIYLKGGALTAALASKGYSQGDPALDISDGAGDYYFKRAFDINLLLSCGFAGVAIVVAVYFLVSLTVSLIPKSEVIVPKPEPMIVSDLSAVIRNIANTQHLYRPLLSYGLNSLQLRVSGINIFVEAAGLYEGALSRVAFNRIDSIATGLDGRLAVTQTGWKIEQMPSPLEGISVAPKPLQNFGSAMPNILRLNTGRNVLAFGDPLKRSDVSIDYIEYASNITISDPTPRYLLRLAHFMDDTQIRGQYLHHQYVFKAGRIDKLKISFLLRGY